MECCGDQDVGLFQHTATRRWLRSINYVRNFSGNVSTHSHPKVAAFDCLIALLAQALFQHTATRRWLQFHFLRVWRCAFRFNTQPKVAAKQCRTPVRQFCRFNTQPPEGGCKLNINQIAELVGFNTQPPEGGCRSARSQGILASGFNTQPPEGGCPIMDQVKQELLMFQHTATRRWLHTKILLSFLLIKFQHTATRRWLQQPKI